MPVMDPPDILSAHEHPMVPTLPNGEPQNGQHASATTTAGPPVLTDRLRQLATDPPQKSLGLAPQTGLFKASTQAAIGFAIVFAALTVGPYFWEKSHAATKASQPPVSEKSDTPTTGQPVVAPAPKSTDPGSFGKLPSSSSPGSGKLPGKGDIADKLGESGVKVAPAKVNPLDKKDDDILKDIK